MTKGNVLSGKSGKSGKEENDSSLSEKEINDIFRLKPKPKQKEYTYDQVMNYFHYVKQKSDRRSRMQRDKLKNLSMTEQIN